MTRAALCWLILGLGLAGSFSPVRGQTPSENNESAPLPYPSLGSGILEADTGRPYWKRNLFKRFLLDQRFLVTSWWPAQTRDYRFSAPMALAMAGVAGSRGGGIDVRLQRSLESWTVGSRRDVAEGFTRLGDTEVGIVLLGSSYLISRWTGNERMQRATSLSAEALLNTGLYSTLLKTATRRTRPKSEGTGEFFVKDPMPGQSASSFPSGHAMGAFGVATVFAWEFRDKRWVPWVAYGTAGTIALSRVGLGSHFFSDVLVGASLGHSIGRMVVVRNGGRNDAPSWTRFSPTIDRRNDSIGLTYTHRW